MVDDQRYQLFRQPTAAYRGKPFWSWNGRLEKEELIRQLRTLKQMGFGGSFMHSRTGLVTEYLGDEWFDLINTCTDEASKLGMEAWLYDEDRWPSGTAGGKVTEHQAFRMSYLNLEIVSQSEFTWSADIYKAFYCSRDGLDLLDYREIHRQTADDQTAERDIHDQSPSSLDEVMIFRIVKMRESSFYNGNTYVDTMNREATDCFIELTHQKYAMHCGERIGKTIQGIFTDEPHRGQLMSSFGSSGDDTGIHPEWSVPWTSKMPEHFLDRYGYHLESKLPELFLFWQRERVSQVKWHFTELLQTLFINHYFKPIQDWCQAHNMSLTGHVLQEDTLTGQAAVAGSVMRYYEHMTCPGVDVLTEWNDHYWLVKQLSSVSRQTGKKWLLSELYGCTGWQFSFKGHKNVGDWQALLGINLRCPHLSWYTMEGEAKRDYPASILEQSAWWDQYHAVEDYFSRFNVLMTRGKPVCHTLVVYPIESVLCQVHPGWCDGLEAKDAHIKTMEKQLKDLFYWLMSSHIDFDYGDEEMLSRLGSVNSQNNGKSQLVVGEAQYDQVIVANLLTIRSSTLTLLHLFSSHGGKVIFAGQTPEYVDAIKSDQAALFIKTGSVDGASDQASPGNHKGSVDGVSDQAVPANHKESADDAHQNPAEKADDSCVKQLNRKGAAIDQQQMRRHMHQADNRPEQVRFEKQAITTACFEFSGKRVSLSGKQAEDAASIWIQVRMDGSDLLIFMLNMDRDRAVNHLKISIDYPGTVEEWDCFTGERHLLSRHKDAHVIEKSFAAGESSVLVVCSEPDHLPMRKRYLELDSYKLDGPYQYMLDEQNICVLDVAQYKMDDGDWCQEDEILQIDMKIRDYYNLPHRSGIMLQPWYEASKKHKTPVGQVSLRYQFEMKTLFDDLLFVMEKPHDFDVFINGRQVILSEYDDPTRRWVDICFHVHRLPAHFFQTGTNTIELHAQFNESVNLEAMYLLGSFGVWLDGTRKILDKLPERIEAGDLTTQGLPFYSGCVTYQLQTSEILKHAIRKKNAASLAAGIETGSFGGACVTAAYEMNADKHEKMIAWPPYQSILSNVVSCPDHISLKVHLTRRNTFGPLHQIPVITDAYGPANFTVGGKHFTTHYMLVPSGLLTEPTLTLHAET